MKEQFSRNVPGTVEVLQKATVGIAGCGGLGSNAAVSLTRAGIGHLILADYDFVELSNLNRQYYFQADVGKPKTRVLAGHLKNINPEIRLTLHQVRLTVRNLTRLFAQADLLIEAFDRADAKQWLVETWMTGFPDRPVIIGSGLSGLGRTGELRVERSGILYVCGDQHSGDELGLAAPRVAIVANMQANTALSLLLKKKSNDQP
jgi:sulfur carrier protein ThiS adenylyltransferase